MGKAHEQYAHYYTKGLESPHTENSLNPLRELYIKNIGRLSNPDTVCRIPKKIHQIWLGSPLPDKFARYAASWKEHHPDWEYILWTDADIAKLNLENQAIYDRAINYAERSDIARYEILYRFGGLYVDTDCQCLQPFDMLHHCYDFYTGIEFPAMAPWLRTIICPNALIACAPGHPIMRGCIDEVKKRSTNPSNDIVFKTGPLLFTDVASQLLDDSAWINIALPATFFYPIDKETKGQQKIQAMVKPETFAIHHWAGSWILKEEAFVPGIKIRSEIHGSTIKFIIRDER
jgi:mannosyltransferase OCH1-like enzyme